jgi:hypothetical protein
MTWNRSNDFVGRETFWTFERGTPAKVVHLAPRPTIRPLMLIGKSPLSLPAYSGALPAVVVVRCGCGLRFAVFTGAVVRAGGAWLVRREAQRRGAVFVDARLEPFKVCACGLTLDFTNCEAPALVM